MSSTETFDQQLRALSALQGKAQSRLRRMAWRAASQKRTTRIASILRSTVTLVSPAAVRTKKPGAWQVTLDGALVLVVFIPGARTVEQLLEPIEVRVYRPTWVNRVRLDEYKCRGVIRVTLEE